MAPSSILEFKKITLLELNSNIYNKELLGIVIALKK